MTKFYFFLIICLFFFGCEEKNSNYWSLRSNQNGSLIGFKATEEYCNKAMAECDEFDQFIALRDSTRNLFDSSKKFEMEEFQAEVEILNEASVVLLNTIVELSLEMQAHCGGYCYSNPEFPILPHRFKDVEQFWTRTVNTKLLTGAIAKHDSTIRRLMLKVNGDFFFESIEEKSMKYVNSSEKMVDFIAKQNTIDAMIFMTYVQLAVIRRKIEVQSALKLSGSSSQLGVE